MPRRDRAGGARLFVAIDECSLATPELEMVYATVEAPPYFFLWLGCRDSWL